MEKQLALFCKKHFNFTAADWALLESGLFTHICAAYEIDGMSEYELIDLIDNELHEATK